MKTYKTNLTNLQLTYLSVRKYNENTERERVIRAIYRTLRKEKLQHNRQDGIVLHAINNEFRLKNAKLSQFKNKLVFEDVISQVIEKEKKKNNNKGVFLYSDGDFIKEYNDGYNSECNYYLWTYKTLLSEVKKDYIKILKRKRIEKQFERMEKYLNKIKDQKKTLEEWEKDNNLNNFGVLLNKYKLSRPCKFWKREDHDIEFYPVFYSNWESIKEYCQDMKRRVLLSM